MSEFSPKYGDLLDVLRRYSRPFRVLVLVLILSLLFLIVFESYRWPADWPTHAVWLNLLVSAGFVLAVGLLVLVNPDQHASLEQLPEVRPIMDESLSYFKTEKRLGAGRKDLIKKVEGDIRANKLTLSGKALQTCADSPWEFDRIVHHLMARYKNPQPNLEERVESVEGEMERLDRTSWEGSLAPLHYAVEAVFDSSVDSQPPPLTDQRFELIKEILGKLDGWKTWLRRRFGMEIRGDKIIKNCRAILRK